MSAALLACVGGAKMRQEAHTFPYWSPSTHTVSPKCVKVKTDRDCAEFILGHANGVTRGLHPGYDARKSRRRNSMSSLASKQGPRYRHTADETEPYETIG